MTSRLRPGRFARSLLAGLALSACAIAAQAQTVTLRLASTAPPKSPWAAQLERFAAKVGEETKGSVKIELFLGGQLGNEQDTAQQLARGRIDMGTFSTGAVALLVPEVQLAILPMYFSSIAEQDCVLDKHLAKPFDAMFAARGAKFLGFGEVGSIDLMGKRAYASPSDVKGIKAIAYNKSQQLMWTALGANSTFIGIAEWSSALQTGVADTVATVVSFTVPSGLGKITPVMTRLDLWHTASIMLMNKATWDKLTPDQRAAFERVDAAIPSSVYRAEIRAVEGKLRDAHVAGGGQIVTASAEQRAAWRNALAPHWPHMVKEIGGQAESVFKTIEAGRAACR